MSLFETFLGILIVIIYLVLWVLQDTITEFFKKASKGKSFTPNELKPFK